LLCVLRAALLPGPGTDHTVGGASATCACLAGLVAQVMAGLPERQPQALAQASQRQSARGRWAWRLELWTTRLGQVWVRWPV